MIVVTAGHVDHGKTCLVRALTGVDTDRLAEEKKRGLSIDIGFAYLPLEGAPSIGFIDVPGHQRFIRNALCGLGAADCVLLVVAADDGPMPQTREHLAIIDLLGFRRGAIVISKTDRVPASRVAAVRYEIDGLRRHSALRDWPCFELSAVSRDGLAVFSGWLQREARAPVNALVTADAGRNSRMPIDRAFEISGAGLVVTGTLFAGAVRKGDTLTIAGSGMRLRVRALRVHDADCDCGLPGQRCAINLAGSGLSKRLVRRGAWLTSPGAPQPVERFDADIRVVNDAVRPLRHWTPVQLHLAAARTTARVAVLEGAAIAPGESGLVQLVADHPLGAAFGDAFVIRDQGARHTLGGGRVIDIFPPRRGRARPHRITWLQHARPSDARAALQALLDSSRGGVGLDEFTLNRNLSAPAAEGLLSETPMLVLQVDGRSTGFSETRAREHCDAILQALRQCHEDMPANAAFSLEQLRARLPRSPAGSQSPRLLRSFIEQLHRQGAIRADRSGYALVEGRPVLSPEDVRHWRDVEAALAGNGLRPMTLAELAAVVELPAARLKLLSERLNRAGRIVRLGKLLLLPETLRDLQRLVEQLQSAAGDGLFSAAQFRDVSGIGRNRCIEILECFDASGITRRSGDGRCLLPVAREAFARLQA